MAAPPTCSTHGAILMSEWSHEFKCLLYYCPQCRAKKEEEVAKVEVLREAA